MLTDLLADRVVLAADLRDFVEVFWALSRPLTLVRAFVEAVMRISTNSSRFVLSYVADMFSWSQIIHACELRWGLSLRGVS